MSIHFSPIIYRFEIKNSIIDKVVLLQSFYNYTWKTSTVVGQTGVAFSTSPIHMNRDLTVPTSSSSLLKKINRINFFFQIPESKRFR